MSLQNKNAIIYGAGGAIGNGVAKEFAARGARVFLTGRHEPALTKLAGEIKEAGGRAEVAVVDGLDETAVDAHAASVVAEAGSIDVSLNLVPRGDIQGIPLVEMSVEDYVRPITDGITTNFITARAAARHMVAQGSGAILALDSGSAHGSPMMGATGSIDAALDTFIRNLAVEIGPHGVRALGIWVAGIPETFTPEKLSAVNNQLPATPEMVQNVLDGLTEARMTKRSPRLAEVAATLAFLASDDAMGITGTFINVTSMYPS
ncbi:SDR family NAD(P)-dependent oxidoreductase [Amycolatopsis keratiniphila]|uniref:2-hydroxycyclohexanecarboxyl-CoA dehydrogenase n=1 Tax=Amycolatopsis keratiniphila subsp. keratiniphila TaxID=227715 RepID=A0A1W2LTU7_9PSEU|nr:SDR family oxidoreductase [Amycolatopsis keratiniphila]OLZ61601.1 2-hydroxycyclohexanecarboxyl-CoA dehydrogenase [Amycolatopsis keratiniphila subsp. nogabecina]ONF68787.1 2-hydroxycyclohexanecarboxyl-CoA dehydrogenase [Amycolatopsis keratiniphila subsp. keratiniphila]SDU18096.1 NADP-dependent 3-hydroxy acid dehydrogenase YdfG [Amycolatopsis keratiniphila]